MNAVLPDISRSDVPAAPLPLSWVGMQGIDLPLQLAEGDYLRELHARADVQVDLPDAQVKGIHMSRLYRLLDEIGSAALSPRLLQGQLQAMVDSHRDCASRAARVELAFELLRREPALLSPDLSGWKSSPVRIVARLQEGEFRLTAEVGVGYSSTCPCSAALARQLLAQRFREDFAAVSSLSPDSVAEWLLQHGSHATPHSQRSEARVQVSLSAEAADFGLLTLIHRIEAALATPLQTAVRRLDEQEFARLNGSNLMFVEDAARRVQAALLADYRDVSVHVRHLESLHPHDAVASAGVAA